MDSTSKAGMTGQGSMLLVKYSIITAKKHQCYFFLTAVELVSESRKAQEKSNF